MVHFGTCSRFLPLVVHEDSLRTSCSGISFACSVNTGVQIRPNSVVVSHVFTYFVGKLPKVTSTGMFITWWRNLTFKLDILSMRMLKYVFKFKTNVKLLDLLKANLDQTPQKYRSLV